MAGVVGRASILIQDVCKCCRLQETRLLCASQQVHVRHSSHSRNIIAKTNRRIYPRMYPCILVNPDGSTVDIKYAEPRKILKLPIDLNTLTAEERKARLTKFQPKKKMVFEEDVEDDFDVQEYSHLWKKK
ncbi:large ribosomal subunit protein mL55-like [Glandiceps talaboti]